MPSTWQSTDSFIADLMAQIAELIANQSSGAAGLFLGVASSPPSTGTFVIGNWFQNANVTAGGPQGFFGWVCVSSSPLLWTEFGATSLTTI